MKVATIARERGMPDSSVRTIVKCKDQIKEIAARSSHLSLNTVVRKKLYSCNYSVLVMGLGTQKPETRLFWHLNPTRTQLLLPEPINSDVVRKLNKHSCIIIISKDKFNIFANFLNIK